MQFAYRSNNRKFIYEGGRDVNSGTERERGERIFELNEAYIDFSYFLLFFILVAEKLDLCSLQQRRQRP